MKKLLISIFLKQNKTDRTPGIAFRKYLIIQLFILSSLLQAGAQDRDINFTSLTTRDGLSSNTVNAILKDRFGVMWFGTEDGLNKFDGTNITIYRNKPGNRTSLQANEILSLHEDKAGNLWIGTSGGSLSMFDRKNDAFINFPARPSKNAIRNNVITSICSDYTGRIWVAHYEGVNILDPVSKRIVDVPGQSAGLGTAFLKTTTCLFEDSRQQMWIGTQEGLYQYNPTTQALTLFSHPDQNPSIQSRDIIITIKEDKNGNIWVSTNNGLRKLAPDSKSFTTINYAEPLANRSGNPAVFSIAIEGVNAWLGTEEGLTILNTTTGAKRHYDPDPKDIHSLTSRSLQCIYIDKQGIYWLGTIRGGVNKYDKNLNLFNYVQPNRFDKQGLNASIVTSFAEGEKGNVFVGTDGGGLSLFDPATNLFKHLDIRSPRAGIGSNLSIMTLERNVRKQLLIGTYADGLFVVDPLSGEYRNIRQGSGSSELNSNHIFSIREMKNGNIWVGTNGEGINVLTSDFKVIKRYTPHPVAENDVLLPFNGYIRALLEDTNGNIWIATYGGGMAVFEPKSATFKIYNTNNSEIPNDKILSLVEDRKGRIWAATLGGGLGVLNKEQNQWLVFSEKDGLQNNSVYTILEDQQGLMWVSTNKGISKVDALHKNIVNFNNHNGIQHNHFVRGSGMRRSNGQLFFGGLEGFNYFQPDNLRKNDNIPTVLINNLRIANRSVAPTEDGPIQEPIYIAKEIHLDFKQNLALDFVGLNYTAPEQNQYAYMLVGFDGDWNYVGNTTTASYTNLDPGSYVFRVKASNNDGVWNSVGTGIKVHVHPPFWRTVYAYVFYVLLLLSAVLYMRHRGIQRLKKKYTLQQEKLVAEQEHKDAERIHELDMLKIKFLTNLSHDFRTPIALILGPVETLIAQQKFTRSYDHLLIIKRNGKRLLNLVNQLLDFRKMEDQELQLQTTEGELVSFVREAFESFKDLAERKKIHYSFSSDINQLYTLIDFDKMERIIFNVLSNAFKFTLEEGNIEVKLKKGKDAPEKLVTWVTLKITDSGIGIPKEKKDKIFDLFFQDTTASSILNQGSGIGLSITKEFVTMHSGTIDVESELGKGTTFNIHMPFTRLQMVADEAELPNEPIEETIENEPEEEQKIKEDLKSTQEIPTVLLVEDNDDFRFYLKDNLRLHYKVLEAANGKEGWQKALANHPQLIVSDIHMPEMDGIDFCKKIKADKRTNHIPVILLTALTGEEDQLRGLQTGANDYITKPFNFELLNAKITNLLLLNRTLKDTYTKQIKAIATEVKIESGDEKLLHTIMLYLEENLTNPQLSVEELSKHVGMSRSSLYNKLLQLTGQTPVEYIRSVKLDKAAVLLEKSDMNVAQISYSVGFSTPNYFAKSFKAKFNMLPSEFINRVRKENDKKKNEV